MKTGSVFNLLVTWVCQFLAAFIIVGAGLAKLLEYPQSMFVFNELGSGDALRITIGVIELITAVLLVINRGAAWGAVLSLGLMVGAILAHVSTLGINVYGDGGHLFSRLVVMLVLTVIIMVIRRRELPLIGKTLR